MHLDVREERCVELVEVIWETHSNGFFKPSRASYTATYIELTLRFSDFSVYVRRAHVAFLGFFRIYGKIRETQRELYVRS